MKEVVSVRDETNLAPSQAAQYMLTCVISNTCFDTANTTNVYKIATTHTATHSRSSPDQPVATPALMPARLLSSSFSS